MAAATILVIYHSQSGNTEALARAVAQGVEAAEGAAAALMPAARATLEDLAAADGLAVGTPEYFGYMAGQVKDFFDRTYGPGREDKRVFKKPYAVFVSAGNDGSGAVRSVERITLGYPLNKVQEPVVITGEPGPEDLARCRELGQTLAAGCEAGIF